jgi:hypothetical protein
MKAIHKRLIWLFQILLKDWNLASYNISNRWRVRSAFYEGFTACFSVFKLTFECYSLVFFFPVALKSRHISSSSSTDPRFLDKPFPFGLDTSLQSGDKGYPWSYAPLAYRLFSSRVTKFLEKGVIVSRVSAYCFVAYGRHTSDVNQKRDDSQS